jgi:hypothetical protein
MWRELAAPAHTRAAKRLSERDCSLAPLRQCGVSCSRYDSGKARWSSRNLGIFEIGFVLLRRGSVECSHLVEASRPDCQDESLSCRWRGYKKVDLVGARLMHVQTTHPSVAPASTAGSGLSLMHADSGLGDNLWLSGVIDRLVESAPSLNALRKHRLHLAAARIWRSNGREVPLDLLSDARAAAVRAMLARLILHKARSAYGGALMLMKGPEVAGHYPVPTDRPFRDLDLLVEHPEAAQRALIAAGFVEHGDPAAYASLQHLPPLIWPGAPLMVEVHRRPSQPFWLASASVESLFRTAVPSVVDIPGVLAPEPAAHALLLVAHAWAHDPLGSMGELLDAAALLAGTDHRRADSFARAWGWEGMWNTSLAVIDAVVGGNHRSIALKLWARHLLDVRERVVLENHISRLAAPICSLPVTDVPRAIAHALRYTASPEQDESWMVQLRRSYLAIGHAFRPQSEHEQSLAWIGPRRRPRRPRSMKVGRSGVRSM